MAIIISSGDIESGIILENDTMTILDGGAATATTVNANGEISVSSGGTADSTTVNYGGRLLLLFERAGLSCTILRPRAAKRSRYFPAGSLPPTTSERNEPRR